MSEIAGEVGIRVRPITDTFEAEASAQVAAGLSRVETAGQQAASKTARSFTKEFKSASDQVAADLSAAFEQMTELDFRQQAAAIRQLVNPADLQSGFEAVVLENQKALVQVAAYEKQLRVQALDAVGGEKEFLLTAADAMVAAQEKLRLEAARVQRLGPTGLAAEQAAADAVGHGGGRGGVGIHALLGGRESGALGLIGGAARFGAIGFAAAAAFQTLEKLQEHLRVTGSEALTAGGRLRNFTSSLVSADIFGAVDALTAEAKTVEDLGITSQNAAEKEKALTAISLGTAKASLEAANAQQKHNTEVHGSVLAYGRAGALATQSSKAVREYGKVVGEAGTSNATLAQEGREAAQAILEQEKAIRSALPSLIRFNDEMGRAILPGSGQFGAAGIIGAGTGVAPVPPGGIPGTTPVSGAGALSEQQRRANEREQAERDDNLKALEKFAIDDVKTAEYRLSIVKGTNRKLLETRRQELEAARNNLDDIRDRQQAARDQAARDAQAERERRAAEAEAAAAAATSAREQELENNIAKAALTKRKSDDIKFVKEAIAYYESVVASTEGLERSQARSKLIAKRAQLQEVLGKGPEDTNAQLREIELTNQIALARLNGIDPTAGMRALAQFYEKLAREATGVEKAQLEAKAIAARANIQDEQQSLTEARLNNRLARAALTARKTDDAAVIDDQIAYYRQLVENTRGLEREANRSKLIAAQARKKSLTDAQEIEKGPSAFDILSQNAKDFSSFAGNLITPQQPWGDVGSFTADIGQWLKKVSASPTATSTEGRTGKGALELNDDRLVRALDKNTAVQERWMHGIGGDDETWAPRRRRPGQQTGAAAAIHAIETRWSEAGAVRAYIAAYGGS